jgi:hypothetical protein
MHGASRTALIPRRSRRRAAAQRFGAGFRIKPRLGRLSIATGRATRVGAGVSDTGALRCFGCWPLPLSGSSLADASALESAEFGRLLCTAWPRTGVRDCCTEGSADYRSHSLTGDTTVRPSVLVFRRPRMFCVRSFD